MASVPKVFVSAVLPELAAYRRVLKQALEEVGAEPVEHTDCKVEYGPLQGVLHQLISPCEALVHLCGARYGLEPAERTLGAPRRSFPQYEVDVARMMGKPIFAFLASDECPLIPKDAEDEERQELQRSFRRALERHGECQVFTSPEDLVRRIRTLRPRLIVRRKLVRLPGAALGEKFVGRRQLQDDLRTQLAPGARLAVHPAPDARITSGLGATTLAIELGWKLHAEGRFDFVFHLPAGTRTEVEAALAELAGPNALALLQDEHAGHRARLNAVIHWLNSAENTGRWLVIIDGVDTETAWWSVRTFFDTFARGALLVTGQLVGWPDMQAYPIAPFATEQAREFLRERLPAGSSAELAERHALERLVDLLGRLPLGLHLTARHLRESKLTPAKLLTEISADSRQLATMRPLDAIAAILQRSVARLEPAARSLFQLLICLAPQPAVIPIALFDRRGDWPQIDAALDQLESRGLIGRDHLRSAVTVHRVVRQIARDKLSPEDAANALDAARASVDAALARARGAALRDALVPHCQALLGQLNGHPLEQHATVLAQSLGEWLSDCGRPGEAESFHRRALAIAEKKLGSEDLDLSGHLRRLGTILRQTHRTREAEPLFRRALAIEEKQHGAGSPALVPALDQLAGTLRALDRFDEAEALYRRAVAIEEKHSGRSHPRVAIALHHLGGFLESVRRPQQAESAYERALAIDSEAFGENHPRLAVRLRHVGSALAATRRWRESEPFWRRALAIDEGKLGSDHPDLAPLLSVLAFLLEDTGRMEEAEALHRRALRLHEAALASDAHEIAVDLTNLASLLLELGRASEAEPLFQRAAEIFAKQTHRMHGEHPHLPSALKNYRAVLQALEIAAEEIERRITRFAPPAPRRHIPTLHEIDARVARWK